LTYVKSMQTPTAKLMLEDMQVREHSELIGVTNDLEPIIMWGARSWRVYRMSLRFVLQTDLLVYTLNSTKQQYLLQYGRLSTAP
jgi:hypothetical protein